MQIRIFEECTVKNDGLPLVENHLLIKKIGIYSSFFPNFLHTYFIFQVPNIYISKETKPKAIAKI